MEMLVNARVLTECGFRDGQTVVIEDGRIVEVANDGESTHPDATVRDVQGNLLLPGFIDVQVNGGGGVLFNDAPTVETIRIIGEAHRRYGTTGFLPTLISDELPVVAAAIHAVNEAMTLGVPGLLGIHVEGPFLNPVKKGAHDATKFRVLDDEAVELLSSLASGKTLVTLAPEMTNPAIIERLVAAGVLVSAGHTNANYDEIRAAIDAGLSGFTHLFNAMSPLTSRAPGTVGAALADDSTWCGVIVDGHHVDPATLRVALSAKRRDRFMLVTDAMPGVGADISEFELGGKVIHVEDGRCVSADGTLSGSNLDMASAVRNSVLMLNLGLVEAVNMASRNPAEFLGLDKRLGRIEAGYTANLVLADESLNVLDTWIGATRCP